jgi:hypothetical protein
MEILRWAPPPQRQVLDNRAKAASAKAALIPA